MAEDHSTEQGTLWGDDGSDPGKPKRYPRNRKNGDVKDQARRARNRRKKRGQRTNGDHTKSMKSWLIRTIRSRRSWDRRQGTPFDIDITYIMDMYNEQEGRCAISGLPMTHASYDICSASIDAIDPKLGHVKGNVQIVCLWVNLGKNNHHDSAMRGAFAAIRHELTRQILSTLAEQAAANRPWPAEIEPFRRSV